MLAISIFLQGQRNHVKSSQGDKMIIFNPKMKKNICHENTQESNTCGDKVEVALNVLNSDKTCAAENSEVKVSYRTRIIIFKPKM